MICYGAAKTKPVGAVTSDSGYDLVQVSPLNSTLDGVFTIRGRTPFEVV